MKELKAKNHITECRHELYDELLIEKNCTLLIAPMKAGKTFFIMNRLYKITKSLDYQLVFIVPAVSLMHKLKTD